MQTDAEHAALADAMNAVRWLAARCDGARSQDGKGFSGVDVQLGHALAEKDVWSPREALAATGLIVKYKKQLEGGKVATEGLEALRKKLQDEVGETARMRRRDVVAGEIWADPQTGCIVLETGYHDRLKAEIRDLPGAAWDAAEQQWTCALSTENAAEVEDLALRWGLSLRRDAGWGNLAPMRRIEVTATQVVVRGVAARAIVRSIPAPAGKPTDDERVFRAVQVVDQTTIALPLRSWVIREALLWLATMVDGDDNYRRLGWARDEITRTLNASYPTSLKEERVRFERASATALSSEAQARISALLPPKMPSRLMPHQWVAIQALVESPQAILADEQGLGKTIEILAALEAAGAFPAIVLVPRTAMLNWRDEAESWLPHRKVAVLGSGVAKRDQGAPVAEADVVVINYESFDKHVEPLAALRPQALVADEAQYLKGHDSARTNLVQQFCRTTGVGRIILATGTPVMNRPSELLTLVKLVPDMLTEVGGFGRFAARYCRATLHEGGWVSWWDYSGAANLGELANRLRETGRFIRRDKASVLPDLRAKQREDLVVEIVNREEYLQAAQDFGGWLKTHNRTQKSAPSERTLVEDAGGDRSALREAAAWLGCADELDLDNEDRAEALRRMTALRQLAGVGKIPAAVAWIHDHVKDDKLVVFAYHLEVQGALTAALMANGDAPLSITGDMSIKARRDAIQRFQSDATARVIVCSLKAAQTAITLTAGRRALMVELDWTPAGLEQAEDRLHRIGQVDQVVVTYLCATDTMEDRMVALLNHKRGAISTITAAAAPHGYRKDGTPRQQPPGPGRPRLDAVTRAKQRRASKAGWQARNSEYMRDYMRKRRLNTKVKAARRDIKDLADIERLGYEGMRRETDRWYREKDYLQDLAEARVKAERARKILDVVAPNSP